MNIQSFNITKDRYLFFNIFYKDNKIYLIMPIYIIPIKSNEIQINIDNKLLNISNEYIKNCYEPTMIYVYDYDSDDQEIKLSITYDKINKDFILYNIKTETLPKHTLGLTTLFKDDYNIFPLFYDYYKKQGVSHFYMYYNGILTQEIKEIFNYIDVTLIEWDFKYWNENCRFIHHAQLGQMHNALYISQDICEYMIFCDLDEYLNVPNTILIDLINCTKIDCYGFCNKWSNTIDNIFPDKFPDTFLIGSALRYTRRSKNIYKINSVKLLNIHNPYSIIYNCKYINIYSMYHFYNWTNKERIIDEKLTLYNIE